jgi:hypothetical protein
MAGLLPEGPEQQATAENQPPSATVCGVAIFQEPCGTAARE